MALPLYQGYNNSSGVMSQGLPMPQKSNPTDFLMKILLDKLYNQNSNEILSQGQETKLPNTELLYPYQSQEQRKGQNPFYKPLNIEADISPNSLNRLAESIAKQESGGNYNAVSHYADKRGIHSYGKYQVHASNIPAWSKEVLGHPLSIHQFLSSPEIQDKIAKAKLGEYLNKTGNIQDVASMWFSGRPLSGNKSADLSGMNVPSYVKNIVRNYNSFS